MFNLKTAMNTVLLEFQATNPEKIRHIGQRDTTEDAIKDFEKFPIEAGQYAVVQGDWHHEPERWVKGFNKIRNTLELVFFTTSRGADPIALINSLRGILGKSNMGVEEFMKGGVTHVGRFQRVNNVVTCCVITYECIGVETREDDNFDHCPLRVPPHIDSVVCCDRNGVPLEDQLFDLEHETTAEVDFAISYTAGDNEIEEIRIVIKPNSGIQDCFMVGFTPPSMPASGGKFAVIPTAKSKWVQHFYIAFITARDAVGETHEVIHEFSVIWQA